MEYEIKQEEKFRFIEEGEGEPLLLLHGLFGALSNFTGQIEYFRQQYKVVVPLLPLLDLDILHTSVGGLEKFVHKFIEYRDYKNINLLGNSLGGHVALMYVLRHPERIKSLTLTGSSGLFENGMGDTYPKRGDYEYIRKKTELTFYDPKMASKELVDELYETVNVRLKAIKIIALAKSETAEAIPFGFIEPAGFARQIFYRLCFRRRVRRLQWKIELGESVEKFVGGNGRRFNIGSLGFAWRSHANLMRSASRSAVPSRQATASESLAPRSRTRKAGSSQR